ncbi:putative transcriptional regulator [Methanohalophilus levihalophilus]|uniref:winged helix-turn-helix domain-containing protein n=1 Tax=Methanohalophilus levihalophilus TaxID=1431282 RepID=UPI001AE5E731|nr:winged helix-turn-helix domain-containing protein [Methanohalophilus levihalophilus]MBP2029344.1 putative transcriptional regulator [Methanohalophilus levihalophilus]
MRRGKLEIMVDILNVVRSTKVTKTAIVYNANLNFSRADQYLNMMIDMGLVEKSSDGYGITDLGGDYLQKMNDINSVLAEVNA